MGINTTHIIMCDNCGETFIEDNTTTPDIVTNAENYGWKIEDEDSIYNVLCPECVAEDTAVKCANCGERIVECIHSGNYIHLDTEREECGIAATPADKDVSIDKYALLNKIIDKYSVKLYTHCKRMEVDGIKDHWSRNCWEATVKGKDFQGAWEGFANSEECMTNIIEVLGKIMEEDKDEPVFLWPVQPR